MATHARHGPGGQVAATLAVRIGPADVGRRITVRHAQPGDPGGAHQLTDVVGELESWEPGVVGALDGRLAVRRRDEQLVVVAARCIVAARVVAPEVSAQELMRAAALVGRSGSGTMGDWLLLGPGAEDDVLLLGAPDRRLDEALAGVLAHAANHGRSPSARQTWPGPLDAALDAAGWPVTARFEITAGDPAAVHHVEARRRPVGAAR